LRSARATWSAPRWRTSPSTAATCSPPPPSRRRPPSRSTSPRRATRPRFANTKELTDLYTKGQTEAFETLSARIAELTEEVKAAMAAKK
jgi:hypothetical protein